MDVRRRAYIQVWAWVENVGEDKTQWNTADVRQGYVKLEGLWGSLLVGRSRGVFVRGNTDNDLLYAHGYGVGYPGAAGVDSNGPTQGQVGFGVLGSWFRSGIVYGTPVIGGFQLNIGIFDPVKNHGRLAADQVAKARGRANLHATLGEYGKLVLFASALYERLYQLDP